MQDLVVWRINLPNFLYIYPMLEKTVFGVNDNFMMTFLHHEFQIKPHFRQDFERCFKVT